MKVVILEDEKPASDYLIKLLAETDPSITVEAVITSVAKAAKWFAQSPDIADLIFMDIQLSDDVSFRLLEEVKPKAPVIFVTAFDHYAIRAFKHNSIDYLLKPVSQEDLRFALNKFKNQQLQPKPDLYHLLTALKNPPEYQKRFMVNAGNKIKSVTTDQIAFIQSEGRYVRMVTADNSGYMIDYTMEKLEDLLDPQVFFRINRQFIIAFHAIAGMQAYTKGRIKLTLTPATRAEVIVSIDKAGQFKKWLNK